MILLILILLWWYCIFCDAKGETDMIQNKASQATKATKAMGQSAMDTAEQGKKQAQREFVPSLTRSLHFGRIQIQL